jgi:hypothetical protein
MTQAATIPSIADLFRAIFNRRPALQQPRLLAVGEHASLYLAHRRLNILLDNNSALTDHQFVRLADEKVLELLRKVVRTTAGEVKEPEHSAIADVLQWSDASISSLHEGLIDRQDAIDDLENHAATLGAILTATRPVGQA